MTNRVIKEIYNQIMSGKISVSGDKENVHIDNLYKIVTPWVQFGYSFYLNHVNKKTKNAIKCTTFGVSFEHNGVGAYVSKICIIYNCRN